MITAKLQKAINDQITAELWSSNLYLQMSYFLKNQGWEIPQTDWYVFRGKRLRNDDPGNIHFGYVGSVMFPLWILRVGAGAYQIYSGTSRWSYWISFFDDPRDSLMITWGHTLFVSDILKRILSIIKKTRIRCYWI